MANECVVKGDYVTHARNLVDVFAHSSILFTDECEAEANASRKKKPVTLSEVENKRKAARLNSM